MATLPSSNIVTYEEWLRMPPVEDAIEEVVNGEIRIMPAPKWNHARIVRYVRRAIEAGLDEHDAILMHDFGLIIRTKPLNSRTPDLAVFEVKTIIERDGYIHSAPQLIVEVHSPSNWPREREEKLVDYASIGVPEIWWFWPEKRAVDVHYLEGPAYRSTTVTEGSLKPRHFPDVQLDIARIWPDSCTAPQH